MTAYNAVRFKVKAGREKDFEDAHRVDPGFAGFKGGALVKTGPAIVLMLVALLTLDNR